MQVDYKERSKAKIQRQLEIAGISASDGELEQMLEGGKACLTGHIHIGIVVVVVLGRKWLSY